MASIGAIANRETGRDTMERARARAQLIPDLLVEARRVANTVFSGWHGRRKRGIGENFWQFRPYVPGETMSRIDWRRSARDDSHIYVQDKEWQAAHTIWLWVDESASMLFKSEAAIVSKQSRALVLAFAMAELLARSGERVGWLGLTKPVLSRNAAEKLAEALILAAPQTTFPQRADLGNHSDLILFSDFLDPVDEITQHLTGLFKQGARGHVVQMIDPVEEVFPYQGRVEFQDPETGMKFTAGNAETLKTQYERELKARTVAMRQTVNSLGWSYVRHHTDRLASEALVALHTHLSERS
ncbi:MAG: DUF58 domain-containing protein [Pseudomonadota bacterium]